MVAGEWLSEALWEQEVLLGTFVEENGHCNMTRKTEEEHI